MLPDSMVSTVRYDGRAIGVQACSCKQIGGCLRNVFQVYIVAKVTNHAQPASHLDHLFHRIVGALDNPLRQKQTFDVIVLLERQRQFDNLIDRKSCTRNITGHPVDTVEAIERAELVSSILSREMHRPSGA